MKHYFRRIAIFLICTFHALCAAAINDGLISVEWTPVEGEWTFADNTYTSTGSFNKRAMIRCTFRSSAPVTFDISSFSRAMRCYMLAGKMDEECSVSNYYVSTQQNTPGAISSVTYTPADTKEHYVEFLLYAQWSMTPEDYGTVSLLTPPVYDYMEDDVAYNVLSLKGRTAQVVKTGKYTGDLTIKDEVVFPFNQDLISSVWEQVSGDWTIVDGKYIGTPKNAGENLKLRCTFRSSGKVYFDVTSINSDMDWNYLMIGNLDTECTANDNAYSFSEGSVSEPKMIVFEPQDSEEHWVEFVYLVKRTPDAELNEGTTIGMLSPMRMSVETIQDAAFKDSPELTSVVIPSSVIAIGKDAFNNCPALSGVNIPEGLITLGAYAFKDCSSIKSMSLPDGVELIDQETFAGCSSLEEITLGNGIKNISQQAFARCTSLRNLKLPQSISSIGNYAFNQCLSLTELTLPENLVNIYDGAFNGCSALSTLYVNAPNLVSVGRGFDHSSRRRMGYRVDSEISMQPLRSLMIW